MYNPHTWIHEEIIYANLLNNLEGGVQDALTGLTQEITERGNDVDAEERRAKGVESGLRNDLTAETTRATTAEGTLNTTVGDLSTRTTTAENNITNLQGRMTTVESGKLDAALKGAANGVAELDSNGLVPPTQLPSYVDDVIEGYYNPSDSKFYEDSSFTTEITGETGKIYVDLTPDVVDKQYRWSGTMFVPISSSPLILSTTLTAGSTSVTFTDGKIATASVITIMTETGIAPLTQTVSGSTYTATFEAQSADMEVGIEVR